MAQDAEASCVGKRQEESPKEGDSWNESSRVSMGDMRELSGLRSGNSARDTEECGLAGGSSAVLWLDDTR